MQKSLFFIYNTSKKANKKENPSLVLGTYKGFSSIYGFLSFNFEWGARCKY